MKTILSISAVSNQIKSIQLLKFENKKIVNYVTNT